MDKKNCALLKALIDRSPRKEALLTYFPNDLSTLPSYPLFSLSSLLQQREVSEEIHYSWFFPVLKQMAPQKQLLFLALFEKNKAAKLQHLLAETTPLPTLPPLLKKPLEEELQGMIEPRELLPLYAIPASELLILLRLSKEELMELIDYLGLYDLATELKQVVDKSTLSLIASSLNLEQRTFLQFANKQSSRYLPRKMNLQAVQGDKAALNKMLHKAGLYRLSGALVGEEKNFLWHLLHKLDTGRASLIEKMGQEIKDESLTKFFKRQVATLAKRIHP